VLPDPPVTASVECGGARPKMRKVPSPPQGVTAMVNENYVSGSERVIYLPLEGMRFMTKSEADKINMDRIEYD